MRSEEERQTTDMDQRHKPGMVLLSGNSHPGLAEEVARHLGVSVGSCLVYHNTNRETMVDIQVSDHINIPALT